MAGNIQGFGLHQLRSEIEEYRQLSIKMARGFSNVCTYMQELRTCWTGKRINKVINVWNSNCKTINTDVLYFCDEMIDILSRVFSQYCRLERVDMAGISRYNIDKITIDTVGLTDENNITFDLTRVMRISNDFKEEINHIRLYLNDSLRALSDIRPYSDSLRGLVSKYQSKARSLQAPLNKICDTIQDELDNAVTDVNKTEQFNEKDAQRAGDVPQGGSSGSGSVGGNGPSAGGNGTPQGGSSGSGSAGGSSSSGSHVESSGSQGTGSGRGSSGGRSPSGRGSGSNSSGGTESEHTPGPPIENTPEPEPTPTPPEPTPEAPQPEPVPPESEPDLAPPEPPPEQTPPEPSAPPEPPLDQTPDPTPEQGSWTPSHIEEYNSSDYKPGDPWYDWNHGVDRSYDGLRKRTLEYMGLRCF